MPKSRLKKKSLKSKLTWIFISLAIFLGGSVYAAFSFGSGPLTGLLQSASINRVVVEDPNFAKNSAERKAINELNNAANQEARAVTNKQKAAAESRLEKAWNDLAKIEKAQAPANLNTTAGDAQSSSPPAITPPVASTPPTVNKQSKPDSCEGGNGVKLTPGKYAATGYGWTGTGRDLNSGAKQRECVYIDENCNHGPAVACDVVYKEDPTKVILPVSAGKEYYAGLKDDTPKPKENCYDQSGVIMVTGDKNGEERCLNGDWQPDRSKTCSSNQTYNSSTNACDTPPRPIEVDVPSGAEIPSGAEPTIVDIKYRTNYSTEAECKDRAGTDLCKVIQGGGYGIVPKGSNITAISYNSGAAAGIIPNATTLTTYSSSSLCSEGKYTCTPSAGKWVRTGLTTYIFGDQSTYNNALKECEDRMKSQNLSTRGCDQVALGTVNTNASSQQPNSTQQKNNVTYPNGKVGVHANSPAECKYGNLAVEDPKYGDWICPSDKDATNNTPPTITPLPPNTPTQTITKTTTKGAAIGCAAGATAGAIYGAGLGFGVFSAPLALMGAAIGCGAGIVTGGVVGLGFGVANIPPETPNSSEQNQSALSDPSKDWSNTNPIRVENKADCPAGTNREYQPDAKSSITYCYP